MFVDLHNDDSIRVAPCCQAASVVEPIETFDFNTSPYLTKLRKEFSQGLQPTACNRCWQAEKLGHKSRRQSAIEFFDLTEQDTTVELNGLDHNATWACNMACIMCGPQSSSLWAKEKAYNKIDLVNLGRHLQKDNNLLSNADLSKIKKIHFNGGEPLLNNHQIELLTQIEKHGILKNVFISYNTNGSVFPSKQLIDYWSRSKLVKLFFSIDAIGDAFEFIRWPGKWIEVNSNIQKMRELLPSNVMFGVNLTVGSYNILELKDVWQWFESTVATNREGDPSDFNWQIAYNFDPKYCDAKVKQQVVSDLENIPVFNGLVNYIKLSTSSNADITLHLDTFDLKRNTNWRKSLKIGKYY